MKNRILYFLLLVFLLINADFAASTSTIPDTTNREKPETKKERVKKNGDEPKQHSLSSSDNSSGDFIGNCLSEMIGSCISSAVEACFSAVCASIFSSSDEKIDTLHQAPDSAFAQPIRKYSFEYKDGIFTGLSVVGRFLLGNIATEYKSGGVGIGFNAQYLNDHFLFSTGIEFNGMTGKPEYFYQTTTTYPNGDYREITDDANETQFKTTVVTAGVNYVFFPKGQDKSLGFSLGGGIAYHSMKESAILTRTILFNNVTQSVSEIKQDLTIHKANPFITGAAYLRTEPPLNMMVSCNVMYDFHSTNPDKLKSLPLSWSRLKNQFSISLGILIGIL